MRTLLLLNVFEPGEIGDRIKQARERAGLRQEDLADLIGMSTRQVQNYESGESAQYRKLKAIAGATATSVEWLLHGDERNDDQGDLQELRDHLDAQHDVVVAQLDRIEELARARAVGQP